MRTVLSLILAVSLVAAACSGGGDEELGAVDGEAVTMSDLEALYAADSIPIDDNFRSTLFRLLAVRVIEDALQADFGVTVDQADIDARFDEFMSQIDQQGLSVADALGIPDAGDEMLRFNARLELLLDAAVRELLTDQAFLEEFYANEAALTTVCAAHILVPTEEEALAVQERLDAGEDFAEVAADVSQDPGSGANGGDLGCQPAAGYVEPFADATLEAPLGEVVGPVESQFGFHLIRVDSRDVPTFEEVAAAPNEYVPQQLAQAEFGSWFEETLETADVSVAEEYGTWSTSGIVPPPEG